MIHIDISNKQPPTDWLQKAGQVTADLKTATDSEKREIIEKNRNLWTDLRIKDWLQSLSHNKCWYSEAIEKVSPYHVDHFRPKNRSKHLDGTNGEWYWWLAFEWRNYRISGSICNIKKGNYFPLKEGTHPCNPDSDVNDELFYILDPTDPDDPLLLTFDESGKPHPTANENTWEYERADKTIKLLHLDFHRLVDERKKLWTKCIRLIREAESMMADTTVSVTSRMRLKSIFEELRCLSSPKSELSSTACACLLSTGIGWAQGIVRG